MKYTFKELRELGQKLRQEGKYDEAIRTYIATIRRDPADFETRLHLAEALTLLNSKAQAAAVYQATIQLCIHCGRPLMAIVACRALEALGEDMSEVAFELGRRYGRGGEQTKRSKATTKIYHDEFEVDAKELESGGPLEHLVQEAMTVGMDLGGLDQQPFKYVSIPLLCELTPTTLTRVIHTMSVHRLVAGHVIFRQEDPGESCFLLARGAVRVLVKKIGRDGTAEESEVASLSAPAIFGEMSLITGTPRSATVQVLEEVDLLELGPNTLAAIGDELPYIAQTLDRLAERRWMNNLMQQSPVFKTFSEEERLELLRHFQGSEVPEGTLLLERDKKVEGIYLIVRGVVGLIHRMEDGNSMVMQRKGPGTMIGMEEILKNQEFPMKATALTPATVLYLPADKVRRLVQAVPEIATAILFSAPPL